MCIDEENCRNFKRDNPANECGGWEEHPSCKKLIASPQTEQAEASSLSDLLSGKVGKVDKYRSGAGGVNLDYDMARVVIDLDLPEDNKLYQLFKQLAT